MKGIIYVRVSSEEQVQGTSLNEQERRCQAYCAENNIEVLQMYREEGESAKSAKRTEFLKAIEFCRVHKGEVGAFVVLKVDRFARNTEDHFAVRKILRDYGVTLQSVTENIGDSPQEKFMETLLAATADFDNAIRTERSTGGMEAKLRAGLWPWKAPIGYMRNPKREKESKKTLPDVPDPVLYPILQTALKEFSQGLHTQASLGRRLDELGFNTSWGKKPTAQFVQSIMRPYRLKFYAGKLINSLTNGEEHLGFHQPMITEQEHDLIVGYLQGKKRPKQRHDRLNPNYPLKGGTALCGSCGRPLTGSGTRGHGGHYPYYHCYNKQCAMRGRGIQKDTMEAQFITKLDEIAPTLDFVDYFKKHVVSEWNDIVGQMKGVRNEYENKKRELEQRLVKIKEYLEDETYSKAEDLERKEKTENELLTIKISSSEAHIEQINVELLIDESAVFLQSLGTHWEDLAPTLKPRFQKLVFPDGISYTRGVGFGTAKMDMIFELNRQYAAGNYNLVRPVGFEPTTIRLRVECSTN